MMSECKKTHADEMHTTHAYLQRNSANKKLLKEELFGDTPPNELQKAIHNSFPLMNTT